MLATLQQYLDRMDGNALDAEALLSGQGIEALSTLARLRLEQARVMTAYQLFVHREVFEPLIAGGNPAEVAKAKQLKVECICLAEDFRAYARTWTETDPAGHWDAYVRAATGMFGRVRNHIAHVRRDAPSYLTGRKPQGLVPPLGEFRYGSSHAA